MKKLKKLKLSALGDNELNEFEMNVLRGGENNCCCSVRLMDKEDLQPVIIIQLTTHVDLDSYYGCAGGNNDTNSNDNRILWWLWLNFI